MLPGLASEHRLSKAEDQQPVYARFRRDGGLTISCKRARISLDNAEVTQLLAAAKGYDRNTTTA